MMYGNWTMLVALFGNVGGVNDKKLVMVGERVSQ